MPLSAMPDHLNSKEEIEAAFPDDSQYGTKTLFGKLYRWYQKKSKTWFAFSYRCTERWARWRKYPKVLLAIKGKGPFRYETDQRDAVEEVKYLFNQEIWLHRDIGPSRVEHTEGYLSRIQYYTRWHFAIQWPLMISFHFYPKAEDVPSYKISSSKGLKGKLWFAYWGHFDADLIYWMVTSGYLGRNWK